MYLIACIGAVLLVLTGVLSEKEALGAIHQPTIFLFAGVLTLSDAIKVTGVGDLVADYMIKMVGDTTNPYVMMAVFFYDSVSAYTGYVESGDIDYFHSTGYFSMS